MSQRYADIIIDISHEAIDRKFQYKIPEELIDEVEIGTLVQVPFGKGNSKRKGYVIDIKDTPDFDVTKIKAIDSVPEKCLAIEGKLIKLADWMRRYYGSTMIHALETVMPVKKQVRKVDARVKSEGMEMFNPPVLSLSAAQQSLVDEFDQDRHLPDMNPPVYLLYGITGSGKTEVYIDCIKKCVSDGKQAIVLIPEISLASQTVARFKQHFGDRVVAIHSEMNSGEKYRAVMMVKNHEADVIIGPRSALFAPCDDLGLIVIDEEHDGAYKSEQSPAYHAREVAIKRAQIENVPLILGSATPSLESYYRASKGEFKLWKLEERPENMKLPEVKIIDMRQEMRQGNRSIVSKELYDAITDRLEKKEQIMLFLNRRGFNSCLSCRDCGDAVMCPRCDMSLSLHNNKKLLCHYCGYTMEKPVVCPSCKSKLLAGFGVGTEKIEQELNKIFPTAKIIRLDKDTTTAKGSRERMLNAFKKHQADILLGTQMIVKGHDFSNVTLVGTIIADISLFENDFRAGERTFQLMTQAAGRAGRGDKEGLAIIQTYKPEHYAIMTAGKQDYEEFYNTEITYRRLMKYPPAYNMAVILVQSKEEELARQASEKLGVLVKDLLGNNKLIKILGPTEATIARLNDKYRKVIYIKTNDIATLESVMDAINEFSMENVSVSIDINPMDNY